MSGRTAPPAHATRTRPGDHDHVPQKRALDKPLTTQTRLFGRDGPPSTIAMHASLGFHMGELGERTLWSHDSASMTWLSQAHPDRRRVASTWPSEAHARRTLVATLSLADWQGISFASVRADVAEAPRADWPDPDPVPTWMCSIEACSRATGMFPPLQCHLLQGTMTRR